MSSRFRKLESRQWVPNPVEDVIAIFKDPNVLSEMAPPHMHATIECDGPTRNEAQVIIRMKAYGIVPLKWLSKISDVEESETHFKFVDIQISGPFAHWKHTHVIRKADGDFHGRSGQDVHIDQPGTWVEDSVEYKMPFSTIGSIAHKLFAGSQLESMFAFRKKVLVEILARNSESSKTDLAEGAPQTET